MRTSTAEGASAAPIPWLAAIFVSACVAVTLWGYAVESRVSEAAEAALAKSHAYFLDHPYLEPGPALAGSLPPEFVESVRGRFEARRIERGSVQTPPGVVRRQQDTLDEMTAAALAGAGSLPARRLGVVPADGVSGAWLAYPLLHVGGLPVAGSALLLLFLGLYLERAYGRMVFAVQALAVGVAGAAAFAASFPHAERVALVGSAPLAAGLLVIFALRHWGERTEGFYITGLVLGVLWLALPPWLGARWSLGDAQLVGHGPELAASAVFRAYAGAAACGAVTVLLARVAGLGARRGARATGIAAHPLYARAMRAREQGRSREAFEALDRLVNEKPDSHRAALAMAEVAQELGRSADAGSALVRAVRAEIKHGLDDAAVGHWLELTDANLPEDAEPALLIRLALLLREHDQPHAAVGALRLALERSNESAAHVVASRVAKAARDLDPAVAEAAAWRALGSVDLSLEERQALEGLLAAVLPPPADRVTQAFSPPEPPRAAVPDPESAAPDAAPSRPAAIDIETNDRVLDAVLAVPVELGPEGVQISTPEGGKKLLRYERIEAVAVAAVHGLGAKPVILVDLVLNWMSTTNETLRVIRFRGDRFDPRRLVEGTSSPVDALRSAVKTILDRSGGTPLPDPSSALGTPFASFEELALYHRTVLMVEAGEGSAG